VNLESGAGRALGPHARCHDRNSGRRRNGRAADRRRAPDAASGPRNLARRYQQGGLERALYDKQRPGAATLLSAQQRQRIIAMVCSDPLPGCAR